MNKSYNLSSKRLHCLNSYGKHLRSSQRMRDKQMFHKRQRMDDKILCREAKYGRYTN